MPAKSDCSAQILTGLAARNEARDQVNNVAIDYDQHMLVFIDDLSDGTLRVGFPDSGVSQRVWRD